MTDVSNRISFIFDSYDRENNFLSVEKDIGTGVKRRYLGGVSSGPKLDGHGERMTDKCIKSFQAQAESGDILLYADRHGVAFTQDVGILTKSQITPSGEWSTEFRLYDEQDNPGPLTLETADKLWKQVNGLPPYSKPRQRGFSIEGFIPEGGILSMDAQGGKRVIDDIHLDGCVVVPRPAYIPSMAYAVAKALGDPLPGRVKSGIRKSLLEVLVQSDLNASYYRKRYQLQDALEEKLEEIMRSGSPDKRDLLEVALDEYKEILLELVMGAEGLLMNGTEPSTRAVDEASSVYKSKKVVLLKDLVSNLDSMIQKYEN